MSIQLVPQETILCYCFVIFFIMLVLLFLFDIKFKFTLILHSITLFLITNFKIMNLFSIDLKMPS